VIVGWAGRALRRVTVGTVLGTVALGVLVVAPARPADAHPLGNFSVNQLGALNFHPDRVELRAIVDFAELPTLQNRPAVNANGTASYADKTCGMVARGYAVSIGTESLAWRLQRSSLSYHPGAAGLSTSRLTCEMSAPARLDRPAAVAVKNTYLTDRVGWRELTASGHGVHLRGNVPPTASASDDLRAYPDDLLAEPLDVRSARFESAPGVDTRRGGTAGRPAGSAPWLGGAEGRLRAFVGGDLTPWIGALAVVLAIVLGAAHAALPGHGKTVMAMYLAGRAGRPRDAVVVGATVTLTHTGGVVAVGLVVSGAVSIAGERVLGWLGLASGVLVAVVGATMLWSALRHHAHRRPHHSHDPRDIRHSGHRGHRHPHKHHDEHHQTHLHNGHHRHDRPHTHLDDGHQERHPPEVRPVPHGQPDRASPRSTGRLGLAAIGIAGGLVPSPSALVVLLGAIGLGRTAFGLLLVLAYGVGMAGTLTAAGLLLLWLRDRVSGRSWRARRWSAFAGRLVAALPTATAGGVLLLGSAIAGRAMAGVFG
jgi:nickel/cobalt transporter (NicO) family protein